MKAYKGNFGDLIEMLHPDLVVYTKNIYRREYEVPIYNADNNNMQVQTLRPSEGRKWSGHISVCRHPLT